MTETRPQDGWLISHTSAGYVARYLPNADQQEDYASERGPFPTRDEAVTFATSNHTAQGVVNP